jgi:hypothetical protein
VANQPDQTTLFWALVRPGNQVEVVEQAPMVDGLDKSLLPAGTKRLVE